MWQINLISIISFFLVIKNWKVLQVVLDCWLLELYLHFMYFYKKCIVILLIITGLLLQIIKLLLKTYHFI